MFGTTETVVWMKIARWVLGEINKITEWVTNIVCVVRGVRGVSGVSVVGVVDVVDSMSVNIVGVADVASVVNFVSVASLLSVVNVVNVVIYGRNIFLVDSESRAYSHHQHETGEAGAMIS